MKKEISAFAMVLVIPPSNPAIELAIAATPLRLAIHRCAHVRGGDR